MNSEREIVMKLREAKELDESSFEAGGKKYKCVFGKYYCDDKQISRDEYFKAKDGGSASASSNSEDLNSQAKEMFKYSSAPDGSNPEMERFEEIESEEEKVRFLRIAKVTYDMAEKGKELWDVDRQLAKDYIDYLSVGDPKILDKLEKGLGINAKSEPQSSESFMKPKMSEADFDTMCRKNHLLQGISRDDYEEIKYTYLDGKYRNRAEFINDIIDHSSKKLSMDEADKIISSFENATTSSKKPEGLSFEDVQDLAKKHYKNGGDSFYETWDKDQFEDYVKEFGPMTEKDALRLFRTYKETQDSPEEGESGLMQKTESFLNANPHYDMFDDDEDYMDQIRGYSNAIKDIEATYEDPKDKGRKAAYDKLTKKFAEFEKHAPESLKKQVDFIRDRLSDATEEEPVEKSPYEDYKPEQFDSDMDEFEYEVEDVIDAIRDVHPMERDDYIDKLTDIADKLDRMEEYLTDEQYERSEQIMSKIRRAEDTEYEGPSKPEYDDPYRYNGVRREDFY